MNFGYEYKVLQINLIRETSENIQTKLNEYGTDGWELTHVVSKGTECLLFLRKLGKDLSYAL